MGSGAVLEADPNPRYRQLQKIRDGEVTVRLGERLAESHKALGGLTRWGDIGRVSKRTKGARPGQAESCGNNL